ncbi:acyclic terpene utilization AtuA family protein [Desulfofalx alkaliphila]|uniref:acyclic terpene utilization AtuA family protein n=1 Tax=Desulfofalx alkaliphila TaxID=105483 RepID=UPI0004E131C4|nr:acyclic terpene utilization AtuA family protein [Desulfofalx alkaliphila]
MDNYRVLSPTAILGYGFPKESFYEGLKRDPDIIAVDAGSTDPGPYYLGAGVSFTDGNAVKRDLEIIIGGALEHQIPVLIGTAGGCGANSHLQWNLNIIKHLAKEKNWNFKIAVISSELDKDYLLQQLEKGKIVPLHPAPELTPSDILTSTNIVAQMGVEPLIKALNDGAQVVLAGRCYDPAVFAADAIRKGYDPGLAIHMGKILECGAIAAEPGSGSDSALGTLVNDGFIVEPLNPKRRCTVTSVAAHTLYEKTNPLELPGPGGVLSLAETQFHKHSDTAVKVSGSKFIPTDKYYVKLEGAKKVGYRTISIAGCRDPIMISQIDNIINEVRKTVADNFSSQGYEYNLQFHVYGKNGVMGPLEPTPECGHELGIIIDAVAQNQDIANTICSFARSTMLHFGYPGRIATAGNLAFPYSPSDFKAGEVYEFSLYHLLEVEDQLKLFPVKILEV